jgi:alkylation response protein AidB-like acyl-CoA dehydrogenase
MDFSFSKDQDLIRKSAKEFFEKECPKEKVRELKKDPKGFDPKTWKKMVELGFTGLVIPEAYQGTEGEFLDLMIFMEELGRNIVPCPFFTTVGQCGLALDAFGTPDQKKKFLPGIAGKGDVWSYAVNEAKADYTPEDIQLKATPSADGFELTGTKLFVPYANSAKWLLVPARTRTGRDPKDGITFFMVEAGAKGISVEEIPTAAKDMKCEVQFDKVLVSKDNRLGSENDGFQIMEYLIQMGSVLKAAEMSGGMQEAMELANAYAKTRHQFGKPIGSFQSLQHRMVKMLTHVDGLKHLVYEAAWNINQGTSDRMLNSMVKAKANEAYHRVCIDAVYIHGAIGWTEEMDVSLYLLRSKANENDCGGTLFHKERIAEELEKSEPMFLSMRS